MITYYQNLNRHLIAIDEAALDAIVATATGNPQAGIGYPPRHEAPRVWLECCEAEVGQAIRAFLARRGYLEKRP